MEVAISEAQRQEAQRQVELLRLDEEIARRECRRSFLQYCRHPDLFPDEPPAQHHEFMISALEGVERGEIKRLMVLMPPSRQVGVLLGQVPKLVSGQAPQAHVEGRQLGCRG